MRRLALIVAAVAGLVARSDRQAYAIDRGRAMGLYAAPTGAPLAMLDSRIDLTVRGPIVEAVVVQRFRNPGDRATEASYIFPLPADAAVSAMAIQIGARTIRAAIERREAAQQRYEAAVAAGVGAGLLDQERSDVFTQTIAAIPPHGVVEVTLRYDTLARYEAGIWQLVVPMVVAPRFVPGTASGRATTGGGWAPDTDRAPDASRVTPAAVPGAGGSTAIAIHFADEPVELASPSHELSGTRRDPTLSDPRSDHDAIVRWRAPAASSAWVERDGDAGFAAVVVEAPAAAPRARPVRVILAIDRAATTRGDGDAVEHPLVRALLGALNPSDQVRVIGSDALGWSSPGPALRAIERAWPSPAPAFDLTRVLAGARPEGAAIVLISDGLVADDPAAVAAARRLGVAVHAIGLGPAPARATLGHIAAATGGTLRFAVAGDDVLALARSVLADVASAPPPLAIHWGALAASEVEPAVLPRLGAGQAMLVLARIARAEAGNARARGELFAFEPLDQLAPARRVDGSTTPHGALARRWARERLGDLVATAADRARVTDHALRYGLVSPYTSLVAIGSEVIVQGGVKRSIAVPVSLPAGMQWHAVKQSIERPVERPVERPIERPVEHPVELNTSRSSAPAGDKVGIADRERSAAGPGPRPADRGRSTADTAPAPGRADDAKHESPATGAARPDRTAALDPGAASPAPRPAGEPPGAVTVRGEVIHVTGSTIGRRETDAPSPVSVIDADAERITTEGLAVGPGRPWRITAALGGGLVLDRGAHGLAAIDARVEATWLGLPGTLFGAEAALWLAPGKSPGADTEARVLATFARRVARRLELGFGTGIQFGAGVGPTGSLRLRAGSPLPWLAGYLRYDAAALLTRPTVEIEHAITLGLELSY
jgi:Ca-activated chloride channel family protein